MEAADAGDVGGTVGGVLMVEPAMMRSTRLLYVWWPKMRAASVFCGSTNHPCTRRKPVKSNVANSDVNSKSVMELNLTLTCTRL